MAQPWIVGEDDSLFERRTGLYAPIGMRRISARLHGLLHDDNRGGLIDRLSIQDLRAKALTIEALLSVSVGRQADAATNKGHECGQKCDPSHG